MNLALSILALALQVTPPPSPPPLTTPAPSPSATVAPSASPTTGAILATPAGVNVHPSQSQTVTLSNTTGAISAQSDSPIVTVAVDQQARTVTVSASTQTGHGNISVRDASGASIQIPVKVAFDAGTVPAAMTLRVTGTAVDPSWLQTQVQKLVTQAVQVQPGALLQTTPSQAPAPFAPGATAVIPVHVHIAGGDQYFDVNVSPSVTVQNLQVPPFLSPLLFYDDDPEKIPGDGVLYRNELSATTPARLYYYHQNGDGDRTLYVVLRALQSPATIQLIDASAGPNPDVMTVGHNVSRNFLLQETGNEGVIVDLAPGTPYIQESFAMKHLDGVAGSVGMHLLSGGAVEVTVLSVALPAPGTPDAPIASDLDLPQLQSDGHHRTGTFRLIAPDGSAYGTQIVAYTVGGPDASTQYGATSPPAADASSGHDYGDYGVIRTFTFDLSNPTDQSAMLYFYERPMGGAVRSSFLVNGTLVQPGCARLPERYQVGGPLTVQARVNVQLSVVTMTDGGSNYPLEIGVTAQPPLQSTPPISAPDGCFPKTP